MMQKRNFSYLCSRLPMAALFLVSCISGHAIIAKPGLLEAAQPDGSNVAIYLYGNEFNHSAYSEDGYLLTTDGEGYYVFADLNERGDIVPSGIRDINIDSRSSSTTQAIMKLDLKLKEIKDNPGLTKKGTKRNGPGLMPTKFPSKGEHRSLVILVEFSNKSFTITDPKDYYTRMLNEEGFSEDGGTGSARDYFTTNSMGQFSPRFDVYGPIKLSHPYSYYGANANGFDGRPEQLAIDACTILDDSVDFTMYDCNGDNIIDNVYIFYAGYGEADGGSPDTIWPHSWDVTAATSTRHRFDGMLLDHYACSNEIQYTGKKPDGIGTFCHEFCHVLGLPDLYNTGYAKGVFTPGSWEVLDTGSYNNNSRTPGGMSSFARYALDWMKPDVLTNGNRELPPLMESNKAFLITTENENEFFLLENRQQTGFDISLPGHGMLVWHIDYVWNRWYSNSVNTDANHQYVDLVEADNIQSASTRPGDAFPGTSNVTELSRNTSPALVSWAGVGLDPVITDITETADGIITFTVSGVEFSDIPDDPSDEDDNTDNPGTNDDDDDNTDNPGTNDDDDDNTDNPGTNDDDDDNTDNPGTGDDDDDNTDNPEEEEESPATSGIDRNYSSVGFDIIVSGKNVTVVSQTEVRIFDISGNCVGRLSQGSLVLPTGFYIATDSRTYRKFHI